MTIQIQKLEDRSNLTSEQIANKINDIAEQLSNGKDEAEIVTTNVFLKKERTLKPQGFAFCYHDNFSLLVNKLTIMEVRVALALVKCCEFGNLVNIQKQLVAEMAEVHPTHIARVYKGLTAKGFLIEKTGLTTISGRKIKSQALFVNPIFMSKGTTETFVGTLRSEEGITFDQGRQIAKQKLNMEFVKVVEVDNKLKKAQQKKAAKVTNDAIKKIKNAVDEIDPRQQTIFENLEQENPQILEAIKERLEDSEISF